MQRQIAAADAGRARAAIGLQHIAVDNNLALAEQTHVAGRAQRATNQTLNLYRTTALLALGRFTIDALWG